MTGQHALQINITDLTEIENIDLWTNLTTVVNPHCSFFVQKREKSVNNPSIY